MVGSATLTTVPSRSAIPEPKTAAAISQRAPADANGSCRGSTDSPLFGWSTTDPRCRSDECSACDCVTDGRLGSIVLIAEHHFPVRTIWHRLKPRRPSPLTPNVRPAARSASSARLAATSRVRAGIVGGRNDAKESRRKGAQAMTSLELTGSATADFDKGDVYFIGNATTLIRFGGLTILTDPAFLHKGEHVDLGHGIWARREVEPAAQIPDLRPIALTTLSHCPTAHFPDLAAQHLDKKLPIVSTADAVGKLSS